MLHAIANVQKHDPEAIVAFIDAEHSLDLYYANALGVKVPNLLVSQPESGEQAFDIIYELLKHQAKMIVVDSVAALTPKAILKDGMDQKSMGLQARLMSQGISKINPLLHQFGSTVLFTNQIRESIGGMSQGYVTPGGRTLRFYASQRIDVKRIGSGKEGDEVVNNSVVAKVAKNKVARPFQKAEFKIVFGKGIDIVEQAIDLGVKYDIIKKSGAWFKYGGETFQGAKNLRPYLEENPKEVEAIVSKIRDIINEVDLVEESMHLKSEEAPEIEEVPQEDPEETETPAEEVTELGSGKEAVEVSQV
jgi:recombination protein RecA